MNDAEFRAIIKELLSERRNNVRQNIFEDGDEFGDVFGDVGFKDFLKTMGSPEKVAQRIPGAIMKTLSRAKTLLKVVFKGALSVGIPGVNARYDEIFARGKQEIAMLERQYPDVLQNARQLFPTDGLFLAFMLSPGLMLAAASKEQATAAVGNVASLLLGDVADIARRRQFAPKKEKKSVEPVDAEKLINQPGFQQKVSSSKTSQVLRKKAETITNDTLNELLDLANDIASINDIDALKSFDAKISKLFDTKDANELTKKLRSMDAASADKLTKGAIIEFKKQLFTVIVKRLEYGIAELKKAGVPETHSLLSAYKKTMNVINSMMKKT